MNRRLRFSTFQTHRENEIKSPHRQLRTCRMDNDTGTYVPQSEADLIMKNNSGSTMFVETLPLQVLNAPNGETGTQPYADSIPNDPLVVISGTDMCAIIPQSAWKCAVQQSCTINVGQKTRQPDQTYTCPITYTCPDYERYVYCAARGDTK